MSTAFVRAHIRLLARVRSDVYVNVPISTKPATTAFMRAHIRLLPRVHADVIVRLLFLREAAATTLI